MESFNYRIVIQYDGSRYKGWQIQNSTDDTIQGKLESVISKMSGYPVAVIGSGRTDAGVHALGQVANFHLNEEIDEESFLNELNHYLPEDIAVIKIDRVSERFHARYNAVSKTYRYRIHTGEISNVFERKYLYYYGDCDLDVKRMQQAADLIIGKKDFKCFCGNKHMKKSTVRNVMKILVSKKGSEIIIDYTGDGFLQNMIRIMSGTLIEIGNGSRDIQDIEAVIASKNREKAGFTAPSSGLCLVEVNY